MEDDDFEWDDTKATTNLADHGVSFEVAREVFDDPFACEWQDLTETYDEHRFNILGMVHGRLLFVAYTLRKARTRILSARGAVPYEKRKYHEENQS